MPTLGDEQRLGSLLSLCPQPFEADAADFVIVVFDWLLSPLLSSVRRPLCRPSRRGALFEARSGVSVGLQF
jgi:hypothetical protein